MLFNTIFLSLGNDVHVFTTVVVVCFVVLLNFVWPILMKLLQGVLISSLMVALIGNCDFLVIFSG